MQASKNSSFRHFEVHANFQHFRSESYAQALQDMSRSTLAISNAHLVGATSLQDPAFLQVFNYQHFRSAPSSPKKDGGIQKSSTLPTNVVHKISLPGPKKSNSLSNFFKKLSPRGKRNKQVDKPWIVVEFSQNEIEKTDGDDSSNGSSQSLELAAKSKENYLKSLESRTINSRHSLGCPEVAVTRSFSDLSTSKPSIAQFLSTDAKPSSKRTRLYVKRERKSVSEVLHFCKLSPKKSLQDLKSNLKTDSSSGASKTSKVSSLNISCEVTYPIHVEPCMNMEHRLKAKSQDFSQDSPQVLKPARSVKCTVNTVPSDYTSFFVGNPPTNRHSLDVSLLTAPRINVTRAQPPQTLSLCSALGSPLSPLSADHPQKMASMESIGACSLDVDAPTRSPVPRSARLVEAGSALTLRSVAISETRNNVSASTDEVDRAAETRFRSDAYFYISPEGQTIQLPTEEPSSLPGDSSRLPSYLGISCAISGYSSYSRFCHSRDNSPARISPLKPLSLPQNTGNLNFDIGLPKSLPQDYATSATSQSLRSSHLQIEKGRSLKETYLNAGVSPRDSYICNRHFKSPTPEKRFVTSQNIVLNVNGNGPIMNGASNVNGVHMNGHSEHDRGVNGHEPTTQDWSGEEGAAPKSLVQQRIESLFGRPAAHVTQPMRMSRSKTRVVLDISVSKRSPSCPPQAFRGISQESPPVFRRIAPDFKEQLRNSPAPDTSGLIKPWHETPKSGISGRSLSPSIPVSNTQNTVTKAITVARAASQPPMETVSTVPELHGGHLYLHKLEEEKSKIRDRITAVTLLLEEPDLPEEAKGKIRAVIGMANLLLNSKLEQFRGLCHKNINPAPLKEGDFPTTMEDLAGFWDLVLLQVEDVNLALQHIQDLKDNHWKEEEVLVPYDPQSLSAPKSRRPASTSGKGSSKSSPTTPDHQSSKPTAAKEASKNREAQRRSLLEAKRKGRQSKQAKSPSASEEAVDIFIPSSAV